MGATIRYTPATPGIKNHTPKNGCGCLSFFAKVLKIIPINTIDIFFNQPSPYMGIKNHTRELILPFHLYLGIKIHTQVVENAVYFNGGGIKKYTYGLVMSGKMAKFG